jgi:hypothetical protein
MPEITLSNSKGLDAQVMAESVRVSSRVRCCGLALAGMFNRFADDETAQPHATNG